MVKECIWVSQLSVTAVFQIHLYNMVLRNTCVQKMLLKQIEEQERFPTTTDARHYFYHPITIG